MFNLNTNQENSNLTSLSSSVYMIKLVKVNLPILTVTEQVEPKYLLETYLGV